MKFAGNESEGNDAVNHFSRANVTDAEMQSKRTKQRPTSHLMLPNSIRANMGPYLRESVVAAGNKTTCSVLCKRISV